jgi:hypothetical protein
MNNAVNGPKDRNRMSGQPNTSRQNHSPRINAGVPNQGGFRGYVRMMRYRRMLQHSHLNPQDLLSEGFGWDHDELAADVQSSTWDFVQDQQSGPYGKKGQLTGETDLKYLDYPNNENQGSYSYKQLGPMSTDGLGGKARHTLSILTDITFVVLGVIGLWMLASHISVLNASATNVNNTGNVVITTGDAALHVSSQQNAPLTLTGSATPLTIDVTNTGSVPLKLVANITSSTTQLSKALETSGNFCIKQNCSSANPTTFTGSLPGDLTLAPGQSGVFSIMLAVSGANTQWSSGQAVSVTVDGTQA